MADSQQVETSALHKEEAKDKPPIKPLSAIAHRMFHPPKLERQGFIVQEIAAFELGLTKLLSTKSKILSRKRAE
ncbi:hypothetical protein TNCT_277871 [Trichonephila clavata]|uniref:Uncharacterized protein n=1 Tax=Trichonephila clavata TaxID=2740835 RepID=A0A8X6JKI5_TRICU|nr:hypothetical protein TNCT_277871 [Trichonephila clavata]